MLEAGGGHCGGGGGFHSSRSSYPRYDKNGHLHSYHYFRPGYYYQRMYVPMSRRKRKSTILGFVIGIIVSLVAMTALDIFFVWQKGHYSKSRLENYAIDRYYNVYREGSSSFEYNLMVTLVTYSDSNSYDYVTIVGDNVAQSVDEKFGNKKTEFGAKIASTIECGNNYKNLYKNLSDCIYYISDQINHTYYSHNYDSPAIRNETNFEITEYKDTLIQAQKYFYNKTGYQISVLIVPNTAVYTVNTEGIMIASSSFGTIILVLTIWLVCTLKAVTVIETAEKQGNAKQYFEGEDTYENTIGNKTDDVLFKDIDDFEKRL